MVSARNDRAARGVSASTMTVLVLALVICVGSTLELPLGAVAADQLVATRHRPPDELVQLFGTPKPSTALKHRSTIESRAARRRSNRR